MNPYLSLWKDLGKVKVVPARVKSPFWWQSGKQQLEASHINRLYRKDTQSKQNSWCLTSLTFMQLDPGQPRALSYLHSVYVIDNYLQSEVQTGMVAGPFIQPPLPVLHVSHFGIILKCHQPGKWCLILDLSSPAAHSVNDRIAGEDYSLQYLKVDDIIEAIVRLGWGSLMVKFDVQNAYCIVQVHRGLPVVRYEMAWCLLC